MERAVYKVLKMKVITAAAQYKHPIKSPLEDLVTIFGKYRETDLARATGVRILRNMKAHNRLRRYT